MTTMLEGAFADPPIDAARAFRAALTALSRPGKVHRINGVQPPAPLSPAAGALALTLCDPETGLWLAPEIDSAAVRDWLTFHVAAPFVARDQAAFAIGPWQSLLPISDFRIGTPDYPDRSATLIVEVADLGSQHRLTGPGIKQLAWLTVPDPAALRANAALFPLGLDFFLTAGDRMAGLPRTTQVEG